MSRNIKNIYRIWEHIDARQKLYIFPLIGLMTISSLAEIFSIGMLLPFLSVLIDPDNFIQNMPTFFYALVSREKNLAELITLLFIGAVILSGLIRIVLIYATLKLSFLIGSNLSQKIFKNILHLSYEDHIEKNTSQSIDAIVNKSNTIINGFIMPYLVMISSLIYGLIVFLGLLYLNPLVIIISVFILMTLYFSISIVLKSYLIYHGANISEKSSEVIKTIQEGLGGIRDIILEKSQRIFIDRYKNNDKSLRISQSSILFFGAFPKYVFEAIGISLIATYAFVTSSDSNTSSVIATLGILTISAQRLLPVMQHAYSSWVNINGAAGIVQETLDLLDLPDFSMPKVPDSKLEFQKKILLSDLSFKYKSRVKPVFSNVNLEINLGDRIGIVGKTGSGKSTFVDMLMGLLPPSKGFIVVDGITICQANIDNYRNLFSHVPQSIYLLDSSIRHNIVLGDGLILNSTAYEQAIESAKLPEFFAASKFGDQEHVGERGLKLSGGQRQRIGIARALYKGSKVIVLDEATSALDYQTESDVIESIFQSSNEITLIMIAHRLNTLEKCNRFFLVEEGRVIEVSREFALQKNKFYISSNRNKSNNDVP